jgi:cell wall-associated NlpC family hydrolase
VAIRFARPVRPLIALAAIAAAATVAPTVASATPHSQPTVGSVQQQLSGLAKKNSQLVEKYNQAQVLVQRRQKEAAAATQAASKADAQFQAARTKFALVIQAQYETGGLGAAGALLDSSSGGNYVDRLQTLNIASSHMAQVVQNVATLRSTAQSASRTAQTALAGARHQRDVVAKARKSVQSQIKKYKDLLNTLTAQQRAAFQRRMNPAVDVSTVNTANTANTAQVATHAASSAAQRAVDFALAQVGKPYVFGASGPGSYDCSGLTMAAWQQGGVSLPHSAADQYNYGTHVSRDQLQPGDLIFFYQPIGHVTIYIGNGKMVSAPTEGEPVSVVPLSYFNNDYVGATRLVG